MNKIAVSVENQGARDLTEFERKILASALENYRKCKSAEKMLRGQAFKAKDSAQRDATYATYDKLLGGILILQEMVR
jgi:hypothetical protein